MNTIKPVHTTDAAQPLGHYSQAMAASGLIFVSGLLGIKATDGKIVVCEFEQQTLICLENLNHIVAAGGATLSQVVKVMIYLDAVAMVGDV